jgi:hypothetical protein
MNQQEEFETPKQERDVYQPKYPYTWSDQEQQGALPRDEPLITHGLHSARMQAPGYRVSQPQVPWWARPQPDQSGPIIFAVIVFIAILLTLVMGALGIVGIVLGSLAHLVGVVLGALVALLICCVLLVTLIVSLLRRALGSRQRPNRRL